MSDLINKQVLDLWNRYRPTIAVDAIEYDRELRRLLSTNLAEVGMELISRAAAQTELQLSARRYTVAHEAHGEGRVVWSEDLISVSDAMDVLRKIPSAQPTFDARDTQYNLPIGTDCISRQQAIDALVAETIYTEEELREYYEANSHRDEWVNGIYDAVEAIKQLPPIQPEPHWIPVTERLPTEGESVLLGDDNKNMTLGRLIRTDGGYKWDVYAWWHDLDDWSAWMPLPEPYKGVTE